MKKLSLTLASVMLAFSALAGLNPVTQNPFTTNTPGNLPGIAFVATPNTRWSVSQSGPTNLVTLTVTGTNGPVNLYPTNGVYFVTNSDGSISIGSTGGGGGFTNPFSANFRTNQSGAIDLATNAQIYYATNAGNLAGIATGSIVTNQWQWSLSANSYTNLYQGSNFPDATFNTAYQFAYITNGGDAVYVSTSSPARYLFNYNVSVGNGFALETNNVYDNANAHTNWAYDNYNYGIGLLPSAAGTWEQSVANLNLGTQLPGAAVYGQLYSVVLANNAGLTVNGNTTLKTVAATTSTVGTETVGTGSFTNLSSQGGGNVMTTNNPYVYPATTSVAPFFDWFGDSIFTTNTGGLGTIGVPQNFQFVSDTRHIMRNTNWFSDAIAGWPVSWLATNQIPGGIPNSGPWTNGLLYSALFHSTNNPYQTNVMFLESFANDDPGTYAAWQTYIGYFTNLCLNIHKTNGIYLVVLCPWTNSWMNTAIYTNTVGNTTNVLLGNTNLYSTLIRSDLYFSTNQTDLTSGPHPNPVGTAQPRFCAWLTSQLPSWFTNAWVPVPSVVPASALTGTVQAAQLNGVTGLNIANAVTMTNAGNSFAGNIVSLTSTNPALNTGSITITNDGIAMHFAGGGASASKPVIYQDLNPAFGLFFSPSGNIILSPAGNQYVMINDARDQFINIGRTYENSNWVNSLVVSNTLAASGFISTATYGVTNLPLIVTATNGTSIAGIDTNANFFGLPYRSTNMVVATLTTSTTVTFSKPFPPWVGTNYSISFAPDGTWATSPNAAWSLKTTNGFNLLTSSVAGGGRIDVTAWIAQ